MSDENNFSIEDLGGKIDLLIKRFDEQKGIIDSYVQRERDWKKNKILLGKEIAALEKKLNKKVTMSEMETLSLRIFGRDLTLACPPEEKDQLIKAAQLLNSELDTINDKNNALIIAGLTLANKLISNPHEMSNDTQIDLSSIIKKIDLALEK